MLSGPGLAKGKGLLETAGEESWWWPGDRALLPPWGLRWPQPSLGTPQLLGFLAAGWSLLPAEEPQQRCMHMGKGPHFPLLWASGWGRNGGVGLGLLPWQD